jgi:TorA maturation chaperone TorD
MLDTDGAPESTAIDLARECLYRFLALALSDPHGRGCHATQARSASEGNTRQVPSLALRACVLFDPENQQLACAAADLLRDEACARPVPLGFGELSPEELDLRPLLKSLPAAAGLRAEYDRVFGLVPARECPPYETEYHPSSETFFRSQQLADVAGFYRAFGLDTAAAEPERPDHLALELEFSAFLLLKKRLALASGGAAVDAAERAVVCDDALRDFFRDHLAWWAPSFAAGLRRKAGDGFYAAVARLLAAFLPAERGRLGVPPPRLPLQPAPIERPEEQASCASCSAQG